MFSCSKEIAKDAIIYSYQRHINGFSANLEEEMAAEIASEFIEACKQFHSLYMYIYSVNEVYINCHAEHPKVVSVFLNQGRQLHTTHSWEFMLMEKEIGGVIHPSSLWEKANFGEDIIIGNLDTGNFFSGLCFVPHYQYLFCHPMSAFTVVCRSY